MKLVCILTQMINVVRLIHNTINYDFCLPAVVSETDKQVIPVSNHLRT